MTRATKLGRLVTYLEGILLKKSPKFCITCLVASRGKVKYLYFHYDNFNGHQVGSVLTYLEGLLPIKSLDPPIT